MKKNNLIDLINAGVSEIKVIGSYIDVKTALSIYDKNGLYGIKESDKCGEWLVHKK